MTSLINPIQEEEDLYPSQNISSSPPMTTQRAIRTAMTAPQSLHAPVHDFNWNDIGLKFVQSPPLNNPDLNPSIARLRYGTDFQAILVVDGSYQGNKSAGGYRQAGCGFICHLLNSNETWISARHLPTSLSNNSAPVAEAEATVMGLNFILERSISRALIIHDNFDMHAFITNKHRSANKCSRYAKLKLKVIQLLNKMNAVYCCHVRSHQSHNGLAENETADELAQFFMKNPQLPDLAPTHLCQTSELKSIPDSLLPLPGFNIRASELKFSPPPLLPSTNQCDICGCPSHHASGCFMHRSKPCMSPFTVEKPIKTVGFCEGFMDPDNINWDDAPGVMHDHMFVQFMGTMFSLALKPETLFSAYLGLTSLSEHYYFSPLRSKLLKKKHPVKRDSVGPCLDENVIRQQFEEEARKLHTFARIAHERKWGRAMNFVHKTERISPLDPRIDDQWKQIHPEPPSPKDELFIDYDPSTFQIFELDRHELSKKIDSWDVTKSAGLNGFPPAFLIHFNNLTAKSEDSENLNPYFTSFVLFMQLLASGKMAEMREVAINYKGAFLNKLPADVGFKVRNLGMSDVFHRLASYTTLSRSIPHALEAGFLSDFDLGSGRFGGIDKFVKIAQALANDPDTVVLSSDLEKV
jgi:ribonuclease HI